MEIQVVSFQKYKRLSVLQFICNPQNTLDYISGPAAVKNNLIQVKEISSSGNVNSLYLFNLSDQYVFFMDGDILTGAKQNRVLNTSVLISPNSKITLPVSCVEQGRWRHRQYIKRSIFLIILKRWNIHFIPASVQVRKNGLIMKILPGSAYYKNKIVHLTLLNLKEGKEC